MYLFSARAMVIHHKSKNQLSMTFCSKRPVLATSLALASMSLHGSGLWGETLWDTMLSLSRGVRSSWVLLSYPLILIVNPMKLLMFISTVPLGSTEISPMRSLPIPNGMLSGSMFLGGIRCWPSDAKNVEGYHLLLSKIELIRLQIDSEIDSHSEGQGALQKDSLSIIRASSLDGSWVHVCTAVDEFR
jgi:hypothetical protein